MINAGLALPLPEQPNSYLARMARFSSGPQHTRRRAELLAVLPGVEGLAARAQLLTEQARASRFDLVPLARSVPVVALGEALGVGDQSLGISLLCDDGRAAETLPDLARTSLLFQCRDATAALVVLAFMAGGDPQRVVPVARTRRAGGIWVPLDDTPYGEGSHACPGRDHALALAGGMLAALGGYRVVEEGPPLPLENIDMPASVIVELR